MKYASVCSGVEAASLAWMPLGWEAVWFSEIEPFPCAVLKERFPNVQNLGDMTISYSPSAVGSFIADFHYGGFSAQWHTQYVGKQYFTNNEIEALSLDAYCVTNLNLGYTLRRADGCDVRFGLAINNLFSTLYESNGYGYSYMWDGERYDEAFYFPQAPINLLANITVNF